MAFHQLFPIQITIRNLLQVSRYFTYCLNGAWKLIDNKDDQLTQQNGVALMKWDVPGCTEAFFEENFNLDHVCNAQLTQKPQGIPVVPGYIG